MDQFSGAIPFWDISQTPSSMSQLADDDFLALLQKQFPTDTSTNTFNISFPGFTNDGINPQTLNTFPFVMPQPTPPSSETSSSDSPPSAGPDIAASRRASAVHATESLKRKASQDDDDDEDMDDLEPPHKNPNNSTGSTGTRKTTSRRKSGNPTQDEVRLMKRKEQNRAAQRAFRERKEKHVKDLEDKVASLEARNQRTESENENLRDLLSRLQEENSQLKKQKPSPFTFSVPKDTSSHFSSANPSQSPNQSSPFNGSTPGSTNFTNSTSPQSHFSPPNSSEFNFGSLIPFDPAVLSALDDPQATATDDAMNLDFGFGKQTKPVFNILASDPMYMSFADNSPSDTTTAASPGNGLSSFDFSNLDSWSRSGSQTNSTTGGMQTLDELFGGNNSFITSQSGIDFSTLLKNSPPAATVSPIIHSTSPSSTNSLSSDACPKTKTQLSEAIGRQGFSTFVQSPPPTPASACEAGVACDTGSHSFLKKTPKEPPVVMCRGSSFPKTEQNEKNVEVLSAWRSITSNPQFKDVDINELCTEFTDKARCDGTKVVLEPEGVHSIIETLNAKYKKQQTQRV